MYFQAVHRLNPIPVAHLLGEGSSPQKKYLCRCDTQTQTQQQQIVDGHMATVVEIIFLGTGTSGAIPNVSCLTEQPPTCKVCVSAMTPEGRKNMKKNTSMVVRFRKHSDPPEARLRCVSYSLERGFPLN